MNFRKIYDKNKLVALLCFFSFIFSTNAIAYLTSPQLAGSITGPDTYYPLEGNGNYSTKNTFIEMKYYPETKFIQAIATISAKTYNNLKSFSLDFIGLKVNRVIVNNQIAAFRREFNHELIIYPKKILPKNSDFIVKVNYSGKPLNKKISKKMYETGWHFTKTNGFYIAGEPNTAPTWFPVNNTPTNKIQFGIKITVPVAYSTIGNGIKLSETIKTGWRTTIWQTKHPLASYLATIAVDKWNFLHQTRTNGTPLLSAYTDTTKDKIEAEKNLPKILDFLEEKYGAYPFTTGGGIFVSDKIPFSLETQTRAIYSSWADMNTIVHENAHQWWGDAVSIEKWKDICLNECLASYSEKLWLEAKHKLDLDKWYKKNIFLHQYDYNYWSLPLYDMGANKEFEYNGVYSRGPLFIHALRRLVGDQIFFTTLKQFQIKHRYKNAGLLDLVEDFKKNSNLNLTNFFAEWLSAGIPNKTNLYPGKLNYLPSSS